MELRDCACARVQHRRGRWQQPRQYGDADGGAHENDDGGGAVDADYGHDEFADGNEISVPCEVPASEKHQVLRYSLQENRGTPYSEGRPFRVLQFVCTRKLKVSFLKRLCRIRQDCSQKLFARLPPTEEIV